ncbi:MAG: AsnC family transcriptional regulator [Deltaproteobacteria bacterium]|nr:AsnC family transcriptional regulator [Deltaproteobacteria bacterium]
MKCEIDSLDLQILEHLQADSRKPFLEIARELKVSGGTIHSRVNQLREEGVIEGSKVVIDYGRLGYSVTAFIGIKLAKAGSFRKIQRALKSIPEIVEVHYTTGNYSLFVKIIVKNMNKLYRLLAEKLQALEEIQSTETFIILNTPLNRDLKIELNS